MRLPHLRTFYILVFYLIYCYESSSVNFLTLSLFEMNMTCEEWSIDGESFNRSKVYCRIEIIESI